VEFLTTRQAWDREIETAKPPSQSDDEREAAGRFVAMDDVVFNRNQFWPLVQFTNGMSLLCAPLEFTVEGLRGGTEVRRLQVPLILAWALSIHKSQGQTLERVKVDLGCIFEKGQGAYYHYSVCSPGNTDNPDRDQRMLPCRERRQWRPLRFKTSTHRSKYRLFKSYDTLKMPMMVLELWLTLESSPGRHRGWRRMMLTSPMRWIRKKPF
jgi:hypothetical protein